VLIGLFDATDANHSRAEQLMLKHADEPLTLSVLTLTEFLVRPALMGLASQAEALINDMGIIVSPLLDPDAKHLSSVRASTGLKLPDAVVLWLAQSSSAKLMTIDEHLVKAAVQVGIEVLD